MIRRNNYWLPIFFAIALSIGLYLGHYLSTGQAHLQLAAGSRADDNPEEKLSRILQYVEKEYVDTIDKKEVVEATIQQLLQELDPHSYYISAEDLQRVNEPLEGNFDGIGIEFMIQKDTVVVVTAISGGPSEALGIMAGDRIIAVDGSPIAGIGITNEDVIRQLRGQKGTKVNVTIYRKLEKREIPFEITRGEIPIYSVDAGFVFSDSIGYIKISRFAKNTYEEFLEYAMQLNREGIKGVVIDLRGNGGGYLSAAVDIAEELLHNDQLIVYTEGKAHPKRVYRSKKDGLLNAISLAILIDEGSASASEIVAGAIQDNDRGTIIGRRSFGKGLVQEHIELPDHSALRLTTARYYTPSGRSIQKPYGDGIDYHQDYVNRLVNGELLEKDSIQIEDSLTFYTLGGRRVYGGGGIIPDVFIPVDTSGNSDFLKDLIYRGVLRQFAFEYADKNRKLLDRKYKSSTTYDAGFVVDEILISKLKSYAKKQGITSTSEMAPKTKSFVSERLKALIARNVWKDEGYFRIYLKTDSAFQHAFNAIQKQETLGLQGVFKR